MLPPSALLPSGTPKDLPATLNLSTDGLYPADSSQPSKGTKSLDTEKRSPGSDLVNESADASPAGDGAVKSAKSELMEAVKKNVPPTAQNRFEIDMNTFERRASNEKLPRDEVDKSYRKIAQLLSADSSGSLISKQQRVVAAESLIDGCANPFKITQGRYNTCVETTMSMELLDKHPAKACEIVSTAISGNWTAPDGKNIKIDRESLQPMPEETQFNTNYWGERSYAVHVLTLVLANDQLQRRDPPVFYEQRMRNPNDPNDTGERTRDQLGHILETKDPGLTVRENVNESKNLTGSEYILATTHADSDNPPPSVVENPQSAAELKAKFQELQESGKFPATLDVDANHPPIMPLLKETEGWGPHVVVATNYDRLANKVYIANPAYPLLSHWVDVDQLYDNMSLKAKGEQLGDPVSSANKAG